MLFATIVPGLCVTTFLVSFEAATEMGATDDEGILTWYRDLPPEESKLSVAFIIQTK